MIRDHFVYRLFDGDGALLYVGVTKDPAKRRRSHRRRAWWSQVATVRMLGPLPREVAYDIESREIIEKRPPHNRHVPDRPVVARPDNRESLIGCTCAPGECNCEPVGTVEIADRLSVKRATVDVWHYRRLLPEPRWTVGGGPAWNWPDIEKWARASGRL